MADKWIKMRAEEEEKSRPLELVRVTMSKMMMMVMMGMVLKTWRWSTIDFQTQGLLGAERGVGGGAQEQDGGRQQQVRPSHYHRWTVEEGTLYYKSDQVQPFQTLTRKININICICTSGQLQDQRDANNVWSSHVQTEEDLSEHASRGGDVGMRHFS